MNGLTKDQLQKIEENKRQALLKRQLGRAPEKHLPAKNQPSAFFQPRKGNKLPIKRPAQPLSSQAKIECAVFKLMTSDRFSVEMGFHESSIELMKTISGRKFDQSTKQWTFPISEHDNLVAKLSTIKTVTVSSLPKHIVNCFKLPSPDIATVNIEKIDETLSKALLPYQRDGVRFGISRKGRCLIADDMGLGKTFQALGIAHYYVEDWPLLIVCPSSMRFPWEDTIQRFLPSVNPFSIIVVTTGNDDISEAKVVISSYDLLTTCIHSLKRKKFGVIIFDESHSLKSMKSARTKAGLQLTPTASRVILLSGTPALSRPVELFPQIHAIDPSCFPRFHDFGLRYCSGKESRYGWDYSGSSNSTELELLLKKKFMVRRMKAEVLPQLPSKLRKVVILHPKMVKAVTKQMQELASQMEGQKGMEKRGTLLQYYCATGAAKLEAVQEYLEEKLESPGKMLVFAHHVHVLDGLSEMLIKNRVDFIRIDGSTSAEARIAYCEQFQTDPNTRVAVLSIRAANSGITLTAAQLVIFAELFWNPGELTQAEDRAHRIGQQDSVVVEYLLAKGTADDTLWTMVEAKLRVLNSVGLSKDSFKDADTNHIRDKKQPTISSMFAETSKVQNDQKNLTDAYLSSSQVNAFLEADFDSLEDAFTEDEVFNFVDLDSIEEKCSESKKPKLDF